MAFPAGTPVVTLVGTLPAAAGGEPFDGRVILTPSAELIDSARHAVYPGGGQVAFTAGAFSVLVIPTNAAGIEPDGWRWQVDVQPRGAKRITFWAAIEGVDGDTVHLDDLVPVPAPGGGSAGGAGPPGESAYEVAVSEGFVGSVGQWLASLVGPAGATGATGASGAQGAPGAAGADGQDGSDGAPGPKGDTGATGATGAQGPQGETGPQGPKGDTGDTGPAGPSGGGGSSIRTAIVRVTDDNLSGLPVAASWTVVLTSAGTPLQCSIAASAGDRIRLDPSFMRSGAHFLDWALLGSAGDIDTYLTTRSSTPPAEGSPSMYPSTSFSYVQASTQFVVGSGHIDGSGKATIALAHQGTLDGKVYAHPTYPFELLLTNVGPEPA